MITKKVLRMLLYRSRGDDWRTEVIVTTEVTLDREYFYTFDTRTAKHGDEIIYNREYKNKFKRYPQKNPDLQRNNNLY